MSVRIVEQAFNPCDSPEIFDCLEGKKEALTRFLDATTALSQSMYSGILEEIESLIETRESCILRINAIDNCIRKCSEIKSALFQSALSFPKGENLKK